MEVLPLNVVKMLHKILGLEVLGHDQMKKGFSKMNLEHWCMDEVPAWDSTSTLLNSANCVDDSFSEGDLNKEEEIIDDNLLKILPTK